jgi:dTDP-4-amino-4,6-dideoxygalactose transaminase
VSTNHAILYENLTPVFADIDEFLCLDPKSVESRITEKTRAIIFFGFGGNAGKLDEIVSIAKKHNLRLILDAAHMAGTNYKGKHVGQAAGCTVFSFQAVKNLPTADSGMICFQDQDLDAQVRQMSWLGIDKDTFSRSSNLTKGNYKWLYDVNQLGFKYHGNSIMAAIALVQLKYLDDDNARRKEISTYYENRLSNNKHVVLIPMSEGTDSCHHLFQIRVDAAHRNYLLEYLNSKQISPGVHYRVNTDYTMYSSWKGKCPKAEKVSEEILSFFANSHDAYR